jgi:hypothetical protein
VELLHFDRRGSALVSRCSTTSRFRFAGERASRRRFAVGCRGDSQRVDDLEAGYSARNPGEGFTCHQSFFAETVPSGVNLDQSSVFTSGVRKGYKFALGGCKSDSAGRITQYELTATPVRPGTTGVRAFCVDQDLVVWYEETGSAATCFSSRQSSNSRGNGASSGLPFRNNPGHFFAGRTYSAFVSTLYPSSYLSWCRTHAIPCFSPSSSRPLGAMSSQL